MLRSSVRHAIQALGEDNFDWLICHNGIDLSALKTPSCVRFHQQNWSDCPIPNQTASPFEPNGPAILDTRKCWGSLWKLCPPRLAPDRHEIILDNDLVLFRTFDTLNEFLTHEIPLIASSHVRFFGRYETLFDPKVALSSGFIGLPPNYDFGCRLHRSWLEHGEFPDLTYADEQGLVAKTLSENEHLVASTKDVCECIWSGVPTTMSPDKTRVLVSDIERLRKEFFAPPEKRSFAACHFVQANRQSRHRGWRAFLAASSGP